MNEFEKWAIVAEENGLYRDLFRKRVQHYGWEYKDAAMLPKGARKPKIEKDIAIYQGDQFLIWGKPAEVAEQLGKSIREIKWLCNPSVRKRLEDRNNAIYGIYIEDDEVNA